MSDNSTNNITFIDLEVDSKSKEVYEIAIKYQEYNIKKHIQSQKISINEILEYLDYIEKAGFICGHNFINFDAKFFDEGLINRPIIDTFYLSMLLAPTKCSHRLNKPYKIDTDAINDPQEDNKNTKILFIALNDIFLNLDNDLRQVLLFLLQNSEYYNGYFEFLKGFNVEKQNFSDDEIYNFLKDKYKIMPKKDEFMQIWRELGSDTLAFCVAFLEFKAENSVLSPAIVYNFPNTPKFIKKLLWDEKSEIKKVDEFSTQVFGYAPNREFDKSNSAIVGTSEKLSQRDIVISALMDDSFIAVLPTGGGKTLTFQLPALIKSAIYKPLTIVISPLQALMKNHVETFKGENFQVKAISGYLNIHERAEILQGVKNGEVDILYLSPESLRSNSIFKAISCRYIDRFVIDEAHCFSAWGHDFRHDYFYIAKVIKKLQENRLKDKTSFQNKIAVSCFTATAKLSVINDIKEYFLKELNINLKEFISSSKRENLKYLAIPVKDKDEKYEKLIEQLCEINKNNKIPTIIYLPQNANGCKELAKKLSEDMRIAGLGLKIEPFYAKLDDDLQSGERIGLDKSAILQGFIDDEIDIVVATTAFGMGIDKPNIGAVIHYEQSDSIEAYLQESGRGARDTNIEAKCIILHLDDEFDDKAFPTIEGARLEYGKILDLLKFLQKEFGKIKGKKELNLTAKELASHAGIDTENAYFDYESLIKTALLELEKHGFLNRESDNVQIFASAVEKNPATILEKIHSGVEKTLKFVAFEIMKKFIGKSKIDAVSLDSLQDDLGFEYKQIEDGIEELKKLELLRTDQSDLALFLDTEAEAELKEFKDFESRILNNLENLEPNLMKLSNLCESDEPNDIEKTRKILKSWASLSKISNINFGVKFKKKSLCEINFNSLDELKTKIEQREKICDEILQFAQKSKVENQKFIANFAENSENENDEIFDDESVDSRILAIKSGEIIIDTTALKKHLATKFENLVRQNLEYLPEFDHAMVLLHEHLPSFKIHKSRLIYHRTLKIKMKNQQDRYKKDDYKQSLEKYYAHKIEALHILRKYICMLENGSGEVDEFVEDYFTLDYDKFMKKYKIKEYAKIALSKERQEKIGKGVNSEQEPIFKDDKSKAILVVAGPGSGKTWTLTHKIASLVTLEKERSDEFLMLTHSNAAVSVFKDRLNKLIGKRSYSMKIMTFHAYAREFLDENVDVGEQIDKAIEKLRNSDISINKKVLVLDEFQDVSEKMLEFIKVIYNKMPQDDRKIIAVGDDDQCINDFGERDGADLENFNKFKKEFGCENFKEYFLNTNYRSEANIVKIANLFAKKLNSRQKTSDLKSHRAGDGQISLIKCEKDNFLGDLISKIWAQAKDNKKEQIAILAHSNEDCAMIYTALKDKGIRARLQTKSDISALNLQEFRFFMDCLEKDKDSFETALENTKAKFYGSLDLALLENAIKRFEKESGTRFEFFDKLTPKSKDERIAKFNKFLRNFKADEFEFDLRDNSDNSDEIIVSTMHKSKGREFECVYVIASDESAFSYHISEYTKRLLYVAMTRAKKSLIIYDAFGNFAGLGDKFSYKQTIHDSPNTQKSFIMGLDDIFLSNDYVQANIEYQRVVAGELVEIRANNCGGYDIYTNDCQIARLSATRKDKGKYKVSKICESGFKISSAYVHHVALFTDEEAKEYKEVLCQINFEKA